MPPHPAHVPHLKVSCAPASFKAFYAVSVSQNVPRPSYHYVPLTAITSVQTVKGLRKPDPDHDRQEFTATPSERVRLRFHRGFILPLKF